ncbi:hypothetical protein B9T65_14670 [Serratia marcescens]|nr:hypothetical protein [Serratia marcescens]ALL37866.1 hypothetical protein AR325_13175 [Serratia marcescens]PHI48454.1 hypothetical protein B9T65_14670 [Serratia marcescens]
MHRIDTPTAQIDKFGPGKNGFTNGDPATGRRATDLNSDMWDAVQEEVANAIEGNGIALDKSKHNQLYLAIQKAITDPGFLKKANNLSDVADKSKARSNLEVYSKGESDERFVNAFGDTMTGQLIAPSVATTSGAIPWGAGPFSEQLNNQAPFFQPNWQWPVTSGGVYVPIVKGVSTRQGQGYPTAVSFGYLLSGTPSFAQVCIHAKGDNTDVNWRFDANGGNFYCPGGVYAADAIFHVDGNITGNIWGGYLSNWLNNQFTASNNNINNRVDWATFNREVGARATTDYVNSRSNVAGGRGGWWYKDEVTGLIFQGGVVNRADHATWVGFPRGYARECFGVQMTLAWTNGSWYGDSRVNIQARDVGNGGFNAYMDGQEQSAFWWAVGV